MAPVAAASAAAAAAAVACCAAARLLAEPEPEPEPDPPGGQPAGQPGGLCTRQEDGSQRQGTAVGPAEPTDDGLDSLFLETEADEEDAAALLPPAKERRHAASGVRLRAFGVEFGTTTGLDLWAAATTTAEMLMGPTSPSPHPLDPSDLTLVELGAGLALPSIVAAKTAQASRRWVHGGAGAALVVATDFPDEQLLANIAHNAALNLPPQLLDARFRVRGHLWGSDLSPLLALTPQRQGFDIVVLADLVYKSSLHAELLRSMSGLLGPGGCCIVSWDECNQPARVPGEYLQLASQPPYRLCEVAGSRFRVGSVVTVLLRRSADG